MCLTGQNHNWFKIYDTKHTLRPLEILAKSQIYHQILHLMNGQFMIISGYFCANYKKIFHKAKVQTVILRPWTSLNHNWYNSYDTKRNKSQKQKNSYVFFSTILQKNRNANICIFNYNIWINQGFYLLSTSKWPSEPQFCEIWSYSCQKSGQKWS